MTIHEILAQSARILTSGQMPTREQLEIMQDTARFLGMMGTQLNMRAATIRDAESIKEMKADARRCAELAEIYRAERMQAVSVINDARELLPEMMRFLNEQDARLMAILGRD